MHTRACTKRAEREKKNTVRLFFIFAILLSRFFLFDFERSIRAIRGVHSLPSMSTCCLLTNESEKDDAYISVCLFFTCLTVLFSLFFFFFCVFDKGNCEINIKITPHFSSINNDRLKNNKHLFRFPARVCVCVDREMSHPERQRFSSLRYVRQTKTWESLNWLFWI